MIAYSPPPVIRPHTFTISSHDLDTSLHHGIASATTSTAWPAANVALWVPFATAVPVTVYEAWIQSGALTTSNGCTVGVYDTAFNLLFSVAITVAVASDTINSSGMTDYVLPAGSYYLALACDGTRAIAGSALAIGIYQSMGCLEQTGLTGSTLTNPGVPVTYTRAFLPLFGLNLRADAL